jgi:hypothetical protein
MFPKDFEYLHNYIKKLEKDNLWQDVANPPNPWIPVQVELFRESIGYFWNTGQYEIDFWSIMRTFKDKYGTFIVYDPIDETFWKAVRWRVLPIERNTQYHKDYPRKG